MINIIYFFIYLRKNVYFTNYYYFCNTLYKKEFEFYLSLKKIILLLIKLKKLKETYFTIYNLNINQIKII